MRKNLYQMTDEELEHARKGCAKSYKLVKFTSRAGIAFIAAGFLSFPFALAIKGDNDGLLDRYDFKTHQKLYAIEQEAEPFEKFQNGEISIEEFEASVNGVKKELTENEFVEEHFSDEDKERYDKNDKVVKSVVGAGIGSLIAGTCGIVTCSFEADRKEDYIRVVNEQARRKHKKEEQEKEIK